MGRRDDSKKVSEGPISRLIVTGSDGRCGDRRAGGIAPHTPRGAANAFARN